MFNRVSLLVLSFMVFVVDIAFSKNVNSKKSKLLRHTNGRRRGSSPRRGLSDSVASQTDKGVDNTDNKIEEPIKKKKKSELEKEENKKKQDKIQSCQKIYFECMDDKTNESVQSFDILYNDYSDMLSDIYSGMKAPVFKCLYSEDIRKIYSKFYYGVSSVNSSGGSYVQQVTSGSIEFYSFLKDNAVNVATKKISPALLNESVFEIAGLKVKPYGMGSSFETKPVSYKVTTIDPVNLLNDNNKYCIDPKQNLKFAECDDPFINNVKDEWKEEWLKSSPELEQSCRDYKAFLKDKLGKAKKEASSFILSLVSKLSTVIDEYNLKEDSEKELKQIEEQEKLEEKEKLDARKKAKSLSGRGIASLIESLQNKIN